MKFQFRHIIFFAVVSLFWYSCANIVSPTGGAKDEKAPVLKRRSIQDSALNFKGGKITFEFNEFLQLKDAETQVVITPLLKTKPKITQHKKRVTIYLPDSLLMPNTTYNIKLGNAVQDLHEGNAVKDLQFTFSTGTYFDSLTVNGSVTDAATGKPDTNAWVLLYPVPVRDSALYKQRPMYAQLIRDGIFSFKNLPARQFAIFSLQESNNNLKYDANGEKVSFRSQYVTPGDTQNFIKLYSFYEMEKVDTGRKARMGATRATTRKVTGFTYFTNIDTTTKNKRTFDINDSFLIVFNDTILNIDKSKIRLYQDNNFDATAIIKTDTSLSKIIIKTDWVQDANYSLQLMKSFAENKEHLQSIADTFNFRTKKESDYGYLQVATDSSSKKILMLYKGEKLLTTQRATDTLIRFSLLNPGDYQLRILIDENGNGVWDTGNLIEKKMPEMVVLIPEMISIKANWGNKLNLNQTENKKRSRK